MAQTLEYNKAVTTVTPVDIPSFDDDLDFIQKLDDEPNDVGGLSAAQLKAEFDRSGNAAKEYINNELIPAILAEELTEEARALAEAERVSNEQERVSNEEARIKAEQERVNETAGVVAQAKAQAEAAAKSAEQAKQAAIGSIPDASIGPEKLTPKVSDMFAPAGFGLGEGIAKRFTDANDCMKNGWYADISGTAANVPWAGGTILRVSNWQENTGVVQEAFFAGNGINAGTPMKIRHFHTAYGWTEWKEIAVAPVVSLTDITAGTVLVSGQSYHYCE